MDEIIGLVMLCIVLAAFAFGLVIGGAQSGWPKDCDTLGKHRVGDVVYVCSRESK